jgi:hypothetical protein
MSIERFLGVLAGDETDSRIELVQVGEQGSIPTLELRFQRHGGDLGWMTHKRMRLAPGQISDLQQAVNMMDMDARQAQISASERGAARSLQLVDMDTDERSSG